MPYYDMRTYQGIWQWNILQLYKEIYSKKILRTLTDITIESTDEKVFNYGKMTFEVDIGKQIK